MGGLVALALPTLANDAGDLIDALPPEWVDAQLANAIDFLGRLRSDDAADLLVCSTSKWDGAPGATYAGGDYHAGNPAAALSIAPDWLARLTAAL